jgi:hypothetical protein
VQQVKYDDYDKVRTLGRCRDVLAALLPAASTPATEAERNRMNFISQDIKCLEQMYQEYLKQVE